MSLLIGQSLISLAIHLVTPISQPSIMNTTKASLSGLNILFPKVGINIVSGLMTNMLSQSTSSLDKCPFVVFQLKGLWRYIAYIVLSFLGNRPFNDGNQRRLNGQQSGRWSWWINQGIALLTLTRIFEFRTIIIIISFFIVCLLGVGFPFIIILIIMVFIIIITILLELGQ